MLIESQSLFTAFGIKVEKYSSSSSSIGLYQQEVLSIPMKKKKEDKAGKGRKNVFKSLPSPSLKGFNLLINI